MGIDADSQLQGDYYLQTNDYEPFSRGAEGAVYQPRNDVVKKT